MAGSVEDHLLDHDPRCTGSTANGLHAGARGSILDQSAVMSVSSLFPPLPPLHRTPSTVRQARADGRHLRAGLFGWGNLVRHAVTADVFT